MSQNNYISTSEAAKLLGISRVAVFKKIQKGDIKAKKIGRNYAIEIGEIRKGEQDELDEKTKTQIEKAVSKTVKEYGKTLRMLEDA